nr:hypothetical protein [Phenylobacterium sp. J426]
MRSSTATARFSATPRRSSSTASESVRAPLQEPAVAAQHLVLPVAGEVEEGAIDEGDRVVRLARVGDHHRHPGHLDGGEEDAAALVEAALGDGGLLPVALAAAPQRLALPYVDGAAGGQAAALAVAFHLAAGAVDLLFLVRHSLLS